MANKYVKQILLPLGLTLILSYFVVLILMSAEQRDISSALGISLGATFGGMFPPAILWLVAASIAYRKFIDSPFNRAVLHILVAFFSSIAWTLTVYLLALPTLNQGGSFADLAIIIIGLFSGVFALANTVISILFYKLKNRL